MKSYKNHYNPNQVIVFYMTVLKFTKKYIHNNARVDAIQSKLQF